MLHVDLERREVVASVRALVERPPGTPRPPGWIAEARALLGSDVHRTVRAEFEGTPGYRPEVSVKLTREVDGFALTLRGRADGLYETDDGLLVEEVKSSSLLEAKPSYVLQVRLYALMLDAARAQLLLVSSIDGTRRRVEVACDHARTAARLDELVRGAIAAARRDAERARRRAALAASLVFPYDAPRRHQERLMATIAQGLETDRPVLAMAPTGIGKTVSALLPALRYALANDAVVFFATAKTTQQALVARTFLDLVDAAGATGLRALTLRAKRRMCPPETLLCHPDHCYHLDRFLDRTHREPALADLRAAAPHLAPRTVLAAGRSTRICPYAMSLALCNDVDLIIGDVNYVFGPSSALGISRRVVVVADEAHNLFDRARDYYSPFLRRAAVNELAWRAPALFPDAAEFLLSLEDALRAPPTAERWDPLANEAVRLTVRYAHLREVDGQVGPDDPFLDVFKDVVRIRDLVASAEPELLPRADDDGAGVLCLNPAPRLAQRHRTRAGTIAMSATLTPLAYYRDVLGFADLSPLETACGSAFPDENRRVVVVPTVQTTYRRRTENFGAIARTVADVASARPGHYVAFFPSFRFLDAVHARLPATTGPVVAQRPAMATRGLLDRLRDDPEPLLVLAVMGGVFGEGIDLPGDALHGAIIVGPALPPVGFEREAMRRYFDETAGHGFSYAMLYPGIQRVIQAAGRVHRTPEDTGVIVLLGRRFAHPPYADCLPDHWSPRVTDDPVGELRAFWEKSSETRIRR